MNTEANFEIHLPQFEGPFDLLLFFIERDELDIYDIPISKITNDFLGYIHQMNALNMEVASEFILVAATLMRIKVKMLLPRPEVDELGNAIDPRLDLVQRLIEYKKYKAVMSDFIRLEEERMKRERRGNITLELATLAIDTPAGEELDALDLYRLLKVYERVINRFQSATDETRHTVMQYPYSIEEEKNRILTLLENKDRLDFENVLLLAKDKVQLVYGFLAILEMLQQQFIDLSQGEGFNNFWISKKELPLG